LALVAQADSRRPVAKAMTPAKRFLLFIFDPFVLRGRRCSESDVRERGPQLEAFIELRKVSKWSKGTDQDRDGLGLCQELSCTGFGVCT
jgi:hypothetical protein